MRKIRLYLHKITHWEYWPFGVVYLPMYFVWFWYSLKARSFFFFNASNPRIKNAGFLMEPKKEIYAIMPEEYIPQTISFDKNTPPAEVLAARAASGIAYPCIAKPDIGCKGRGVQKIGNDEELAIYSQRINMDFLVQEYIDYPQEAGVFYVRMPGEEHGRVTGIVAKEFLIVQGDGTSTITQLLLKNPRYHFQLEALQKIYGDGLNEVLAGGEEKNLVPYGNHARGARFLDVSHRADETFHRMIDEVCRKVPEFYFGRLDVRYENFESFREGRQFSIIELNGAGSEPTHIYDPSHSIFFAWKEIARHLGLLYRVSVRNHKKGYRYLTVQEGLQMFRENKAVMRNLAKF
ncbi:MAG TPA: ATP-grasp domain-containing protein [Ferruginibacter sp.]|nr:ATP-grasp domain-containing protein [Ferruginibacter sp.]